MIYQLYVREYLVTSNYVTLAGRTVTNRFKKVTKPTRTSTNDAKLRRNVTLRLLATLMRAKLHSARVKIALRQQLRNTMARPAGYSRSMARNPFTYDRDMSHDEDSEFGHGRGKFADPRFDYTDDGLKSMIPIADPDGNDQLLTLAMIRRMDINDPNAQPDPYVQGNTDRYGAQPPLVRETRRPRYARPPKQERTRMKRAW